VAVSYYEVLGVSPSASPEDIRYAYRQRARALHPDRQRDPAQVRQGEPEPSLRAMQVINEAWRVLGDRERRSAYDHLLAGGRPSASGEPRFGDPRFGGAQPGHPAEQDLARMGSAVTDLGVSLARGLPWVAVLAILGAIFVFTAFAGGSSDVSDVRSASDLVGSCVQLERGGVVNQVPCEGPSDGRVDLVAVRASLCPDEADVVRLASQESWLCLRDPSTG
jgi:curved DNA-binding protein CbpA